MICFEVHRNNEKVCTAGVDQGVLSVHIDHLCSPKKRETSFLHLSVCGIARPEGHSEHVKWVNLRQLSVGDEIRIRIITAEHCDKPTDSN